MGSPASDDDENADGWSQLAQSSASFPRRSLVVELTVAHSDIK